MAQNSREDQTRELWRLSGLGLEFAAVIGGMIAVGWLLDRWLNTSPAFVLVGAMFGLVGGSIRFIREAMAASRKASEASRNRGQRRADDN